MHNAPPPCMACSDKARTGKIAPNDIRPAAVTLQGDASGEIVHLCEECFEENCQGGMNEGDPVTFTNDLSVSAASDPNKRHRH